MRTNPQQLVEILKAAHYDGNIALRSADFATVEGQLSWSEAYDLAYRGEIEGVGSRNNPIKYFRVLPEHERPEPDLISLIKQSVFKTREPIGAALKPYYEERCGEYMVPTLCRVTKWGRLVRWNKDQGFNPKRFNPDRIAPPLMLRKAA